MLLFPAGVGPDGGGESSSVKPTDIPYRLPARITTPPKRTSIVPGIDWESIWLSDGRENGSGISEHEYDIVKNLLPFAPCTLSIERRIHGRF